VDGGPVVLLNPNASDLLPLRKWPTERFVELARRILADHPTARVGLTGAPVERDAVDALVREIGSARVFSLAGRTTLRQLLAVYAVSDVLVTNDSGPGHFAALTPVRTVVLFGPETPATYGPLGRDAHVLYAGLACSPCVNALNHRFSPCRNNVCMQAITVEQVLRQVTALLRPAPANGQGTETRTATSLPILPRPEPQTAWPPN
jgi:ADP-heptose:LPS heptosyltransferase